MNALMSKDDSRSESGLGLSSPRADEDIVALEDQKDMVSWTKCTLFGMLWRRLRLNQICQHTIHHHPKL